MNIYVIMVGLPILCYVVGVVCGIASERMKYAHKDADTVTFNLREHIPVTVDDADIQHVSYDAEQCGRNK